MGSSLLKNTQNGEVERIMVDEAVKQYEVWNSGNSEEETDQLKVLEDKVEGLIEKIMTLKSDKEALKEKLDIQDEKISDLSQQVESLKTVKDMAKKRIVSLLEKIELIEE